MMTRKASNRIALTIVTVLAALAWTAQETHSQDSGGSDVVDLASARRVTAAAEKKAADIGVPMNIAVLDSTGHLKAFSRMDEALLGSVDISINKAYTARLFNTESGNLAAASQSGGR